MITSREINTKRFEAAKQGYNTDEVDEFLKAIAAQIDMYVKDKEDNDKKIEVLVESIRKYKGDEEALKDALIIASKQAKNVITEAQEKAAEIVTEAQQKAEQIISAANVKSDEIIGSTGIRAEKAKAQYERIRREVTDFKSEILSMYKSHLGLITALPEYDGDEDDDVTIAAPAYEAVDDETGITAEEAAAANAEASKLMDSTIIFDNAEAAAEHFASATNQVK